MSTAVVQRLLASKGTVSRFGLRYCSNQKQVQVGILGAPTNSGQLKDGVQKGPDAIREAGLIERISNHNGLKVTDYGNVESKLFQETFEDGSENLPMNNLNENAAFNEKLSQSVSDILQSNDICVTLGGDHSLAIGSIYGHASVRPNLSVLWVDAHTDINTHETTLTGNIHGMPLHFLLHDLQHKRLKVPQFDWCKPCVPSSSIAFLAIREIDPGEIAMLKRHHIPHCSIREIDRNGIAHCMEKLLDMINPGGNRPLHVSFDIDALDPSIAPSTGTPVPGGLTYREAMYVSEEVARTGCLSVLDLVEVNPLIGNAVDAKSTSTTAVDVITHALGLSIRDTDFRRFTKCGTPIVL